MRNLIVTIVLIMLAGFGLQAHVTNNPTVFLENSKETPSTLPEAPQKSLSPSPAPHVIRVIDGDTIIIEENGVQEKVRLIGVNTPETVDPRRTVECFGKEASRFVSALLLNKEVRLEPDPSQSDRDRYGRLLRFVFLLDGTFVNQEIIAKGYGYEYTYRAPYQYRKDFKAAEERAKENNLGLWSKEACAGKNP